MKKDEFARLKKDYDSIDIPPELDFAVEEGIKKGKTHNKNHGTAKSMAIAAAALIFVTTLGLNISGRLVSMKSSTSGSTKSVQKYSENLPVIGSAENLQSLLKDYVSNGSMGAESVNGAAIMDDKSAAVKSQETNNDSQKQYSNDNNYSSTNVQVQGVDEEDLVKTDGQYIYKVNNNKIINIVKASPASNMEAVNNISLEKNYSALGIYLKDNILIVVGNQYGEVSIQDSSSSGSSSSNNSNNNSEKFYITPAPSTSKIITYDVTDKKNIKKLREVDIDGNYTSSRMIGSMIYLVTNKYLYNIADINKTPDAGKVYYSDSTVGNNKMSLDYKSIGYLPDAVEPDYIITSSFDVDKNEKVNINAFLGSGNNIYASDKNLYVAGNKRNTSVDGINNMETVVYKFSLEEKGVKLTAKGQVSGTIINQFSMDESNGNFRIATTSYNYGNRNPSVQGSLNSGKAAAGSTSNGITNNLYVLDSDMKTIGKLENIAKGEQIYSVRFLGDRAYMVTFMLTDPLFVIDLKDGTKPTILGELKIPGFSSYLQPYDETHIIGFGRDTDVVSEGGEDRAKPLGIKMAIFDVRDVTKPVQQFTTVIGGSGTYSDVLDNHKALLFSKEKNLLVLPVEDNTAYYVNSKPGQYFQGMYVYNISLEKGFILKGKITHADVNEAAIDEKKSADGYLSENNKTDRSLYINNVLYTISNGCIKANDLTSLHEIGRVKLKTAEN